MSIFWRELFCLLKTQLLFNIANHSQTDGESKIVNKVVKTYLRCLLVGSHGSFGMSLVTIPHLSKKMSPFQALYGHVPPHIMRMGHQHTMVYSLEHKLQERDALLDELEYNIIKAQQRVRHYAD